MATPASGSSSRETSNEFIVVPSVAQGETESLVDGQDGVAGRLDELAEEIGSDEEVESLLQRGKASSVRSEGEKSTARRSSSKSSSSSGPTRTGEALNKSATKRILKSILGEMPKAERKLFFQEMLTQALPILFLSLLGALLTGELLLTLQNWTVFIRIEELFILVPILLNLKGNLEMNLAARFSTSANLGELDLRMTRRSLVFGNLALLQVQALLVSFLSGLLSFLLGLLSRNGVHHALQHPIHNPLSPDNAAAGGSAITAALRGGYFEALLVLCVSMLAASLSSAVLGSFMCSLVVLSRRFRINPDNIATPLASALGDLLTLAILGVVSSAFAKVMGTAVSTIVFLLLLGAIAVNVVITFRNAYVQELLTIGWTPLFAAMVISSGTGLVLETYINEYKGFALLSPVVTAIAGNAGSIYVSRISTSLHSSTKEHHGIVSITLFCITSPVLILFLGFVFATGQVPVSLAFAGAYVFVICALVSLSLLMGYFLCTLLWKWDYDPDVYALPLLSASIDLVGQLMLVGAFHFSRITTCAAAIPG